MAPQMDRPAHLGEARCEISRGAQAKGRGAVLERLGGILFQNPLPKLELFCAGRPGAQAPGLVQTVAEDEAGGSRRPWGVAFGSAPGCGRPTRRRDATRECIARRWSWMAFRRSPPASHANEVHVRCHSTSGFLARGTAPHRDFRGWQLASYTVDWAGTMPWDDPVWATWDCLCSTWLSVSGGTGVLPCFLAQARPE